MDQKKKKTCKDVRHIPDLICQSHDIPLRMVDPHGPEQNILFSVLIKSNQIK